MIGNVNKRIMGNMKLSIELDENARHFIIEKGYDVKYGARPLEEELFKMR